MEAPLLDSETVARSSAETGPWLNQTQNSVKKTGRLFGGLLTVSQTLGWPLCLFHANLIGLEHVVPVAPLEFPETFLRGVWGVLCPACTDSRASALRTLKVCGSWLRLTVSPLFIQSALFQSLFDVGFALVDGGFYAHPAYATLCVLVQLNPRDLDILSNGLLIGSKVGGGVNGISDGDVSSSRLFLQFSTVALEFSLLLRSDFIVFDGFSAGSAFGSEDRECTAKTTISISRIFGFSITLRVSSHSFWDLGVDPPLLVVLRFADSLAHPGYASGLDEE
ncbi:hypothetical protein NM208_g13511 [Fusarium decemcellulare]|uniref:Uncharacterized protein n=1 Tax=Fusarium decemcellulare TaxID=57161 RepID=A0ACC1RM45_9HYPO|nr:hypothetical protein NM208_g13511 [Fusarium decemcellulare]